MGNAYNAFECGMYRLVEGLGFISASKYEDDPRVQCLGTILSGPTLGISGSYGCEPKVYEIVNGAGKVIYSLPSARPSASAKAIGCESESVEITADAINLRSNEEIGDVCIYTPTGVQVRGIHVTGTRFCLPLADFAPGIYVLRTAASSRKFIVR